MPAPKVFLRRFILHSALSRRSTRARAQRRARRQRTRAHAEARAERRRHVAQEIAATRAAAFVAERSGRVGAQPVASCFALWIDALHGEAGQILHVVFPHWPQLLLRRRPVARPEFPGVGGSWLPQMPNIRLAGSRILQIGIAVVVILLLMWSTTSIPTGNVGVLTLFGRVTGETLPEGIHLINPLKSVQKLSVQTQSVKESANVPSNEGLILALDTSLLFRLDKSKA